MTHLLDDPGLAFGATIGAAFFVVFLAALAAVWRTGTFRARLDGLDGQLDESTLEIADLRAEVRDLRAEVRSLRGDTRGAVAVAGRLATDTAPKASAPEAPPSDRPPSP